MIVRLLTVLGAAALCWQPLTGRCQESTFSASFEAGALRVDLHHGGDQKSEFAALDQIYREGDWPGSRTHLTDFPDYGKYRFRVEDVATGKVIFSQGYSTLFGEWQTTDEAKSAKRVFHETVRFPLPKGPVNLVLLSRGPKGKLREYFRQELDPASHLVRQGPSGGAENIDIHVPTTPEKCLDVVIIADGYEKRHATKARRDLQRYTKVLLESAPFSKYNANICVRGVLPGAVGTGPDEPRKGLFTAPPAGTTFNTFDSARYLTTVDNRTLRHLAGAVPYDTIFVMVNSSRYGGAGIYNFFSIFVADNEYDEYVFIHEFGHGFAGLGDEYYNSSVAYSDFYPRGVEPWEPNVTAALNGPESVKWKALLTPDVPLPTPEDEQYGDQVGVFEGAGYSAKGLFRPALDCKMFSKKRKDFCAVCMAAVEEMLSFYME
jgi:hypothetical protein